MMEQDEAYPYITVKFGLTSEEPKCRFSMESTVPYFPEQGDNELDEIGRHFVNFLRQAGFNMPNEYLLMTSLTEDEYEFLATELDEFRKKEYK